MPAMEEKGLLDDFVDARAGSYQRSQVRRRKKTQFDMFREITGMVPRVVKFGETMKSSNAGVVKLAESVDDDGERACGRDTPQIQREILRTWDSRKTGRRGVQETQGQEPVTHGE